MLVTYAAFNTAYIKYHYAIQCTVKPQLTLPQFQIFLNLIFDVNHTMSISVFQSPPFYRFLFIIPQKYLKVVISLYKDNK